MKIFRGVVKKSKVENPCYREWRKGTMGARWEFKCLLFFLLIEPTCQFFSNSPLPSSPSQSLASIGKSIVVQNVNQVAVEWNFLCSHHPRLFLRCYWAMMSTFMSRIKYWLSDEYCFRSITLIKSALLLLGTFNGETSIS
jgi:hypothetical protein